MADNFSRSESPGRVTAMFLCSLKFLKHFRFRDTHRHGIGSCSARKTYFICNCQ